MQDIYVWRVTYRDGREQHEPDMDSFVYVDLPHVQSLTLLDSSGATTHQVAIPDGAQPVFFRRRQVVINAQEPESGIDTTIHCIGWKRGDEAVYLFVRGDGSTLLSSDLQAV